MNRSFATAVIAAAALTLSTAPARAQWGEDAEGAETCREIWRRYGRFGESDPRAVFCEVREVGARKAGPTIRAEGGENGGVDVRGTDRKDVRIMLVVQAQARSVEEAKRLASGVSLDIDASILRADGVGKFGRGRVSALLVIDAPRNSDLALSVSNGPLAVRSVNGRMDLRAHNGPLDIRDVSGDVRARTQNGPLSVHLTGTKWTGAGLDAEAQNGPVTLAIPRVYSAELEAGTTNGPFDSDYPVTVTHWGRNHIESKLGSGGAKIRAVTENGPLSLLVAR